MGPCLEPTEEQSVCAQESRALSAASSPDARCPVEDDNLYIDLGFRV